jgi:hypothetical protein
MLQVIFLTIGLLAIAFIGMGFNIFFRKKRFPETHIGHSKDMRKLGIVCAQTMDKIERKKVKKEIKYKNVKPVLNTD